MKKRDILKKKRDMMRKRRSHTFGFMIKKSCRFCRDKVERIDYKDIDVLSRYTTEQGKILPSRISGNCSYHQRQVSKAIKQTRSISLLSYTRE